MSADQPATRINVSCMGCRLWVDFGTGYGHCRALPPQLANGTEFGQWPLTHSSDWCGHGELRSEESNG